MSEAPQARAARPDDAALLARFLHDFNTEFEEASPGPGVLEPRVRGFIEGGVKTYLLGGPGPDGFAQFSFNASVWSDDPVGLLEELYVVPAERGKGVGRALMTEFVRVARERGAAGLEVITGETDTAARALYESFGFRNDVEGPENDRSLFYELDF